MTKQNVKNELKLTACTVIYNCNFYFNGLYAKVGIIFKKYILRSIHAKSFNQWLLMLYPAIKMQPNAKLQYDVCGRLYAQLTRALA